MTTIRNINDVKGSVFDLPHAMSLSEDDCNVLLVSSRTLFFIQQFSLAEIGFNARYASEFLQGDRYILAQTETDKDEISEIVNNYGLEVMDVTCDVVSALEGISFAIRATQAACGCPVGQGQDNESGEQGGVPPSPVGDIVYDYVDPAVVNRKCKAANSVHWSIYNTFVQLDANNVDDMGLLSLAVVVGLIGAIIGAVALGPLGSLMAGVAGIIAVFAAQMLGISVDLEDIVTAMGVAEDALICALYEATSANAARTAYQAALTAEGSLSVAEISLVMLFLPNVVTNILFFSVEGSEAFFDGYVSPNSCGSCSGPPEDWILAPSGFFGATSAEGTLGTGEILQDGTEFTLSSVKNTAGGPTDNIICILVRAEDGGTPNCDAYIGEIEVTAWETNEITNFGWVCQDLAACSSPPISSGIGGVGVWPNMVMILKQWNTPVTMSFKINTSPTICP